MGAVTVSRIKGQTEGGTSRNGLFDVTWSNSYATGGDTFTAKLFGMTTINAIIGGSAVGATGTGFLVVPDLTNSKLLLQGGAASGVGLAQAANATDQSATVARVLVIGDSPYV